MMGMNSSLNPKMKVILGAPVVYSLFMIVYYIYSCFFFFSMLLEG